MTTTLISYKAKGASTSRNYPLADTLTPKDFLCDDGQYVQGDGIHDDTTGIQHAIDAAFGPKSNPNAQSSKFNKNLFFQSGTFAITTPLILTQVLGVSIKGSGRRATKIVNVATSGGNGFGTVFRSNGLLGVSFESMHLVAGPVTSFATGNCGLDADWTKEVVYDAATDIFTHRAPRGLQAGQIIQLLTDGSPGYVIPVNTAINTNYFVLGNANLSATTFQISTTLNGPVRDLQSNGRCAFITGNEVGNSANRFINMRFEGGDYGVRVGNGYGVLNPNVQGSEYSFYGCDFVGCARGYAGQNQNTLNMMFIGGAMTNNSLYALDTNAVFSTDGSLHGSTSIPVVKGVYFKANRVDIDFTANHMEIMSCYSESNLFLDTIDPGINLAVTACWHHTSLGRRVMNASLGKILMDSNYVDNATGTYCGVGSYVDVRNGVYFRGNNFVNPNFFTNSGFKPPVLENI